MRAKPLIMVAPNGARRMKADHPALPLTVAETVETAQACHAAGAGALHLHIRDAEGRHSLDAGHYREALQALRQAVAYRSSIENNDQPLSVKSLRVKRRPGRARGDQPAQDLIDVTFSVSTFKPLS